MRALRPDSGLSHALRQFADAVVVNVLLVVCSLPVITVGAALVAAHRVMLDAVDEVDGHAGRRFLRAFASHWRPATVVWLGGAAVGALLAWEYGVLGSWPSSAGVLVAQALVVTGLLCLALWGAWVFPLVAVGHGAKRAAALAGRLAIARLPRSAVAVAVAALPVVLVVALPRPLTFVVPLLTVVGLALVVFLVDVLVAPHLPRPA
ncbi:DUF624 domain-containing protein [uncultured Tessaracoccus sp.]|uniref:DUF624 domain-containing protein n=1 Tax=uncultured Tessaracoccus sp. TaxID=905023 RepID=UPI0025FA8090|nr:DUF624 domain-containing protein [uncultured Tessaracoccus sp.]